MDAYAQEGVREDLVDTTMEKKARLILNAKTLEEVDRAADPAQASLYRRRVDRRSTLRSGRRTGYLVPDFPQGPAYPRWAAKIPFSI